jgi:transposase-like protein
VKWPQVRGREEPYRAPVWRQGATTRDVLTRRIGERDVGGMSPRDSESRVARALGQGVLSERTGSELTDTVREESEAWRRRELRQEAGASLFIATGYEPFRRWGQKPGGLCGWALGEEGRKVLLRLSTTTRERSESCREGLRGLAKRGRHPPVTSPTAGAGGVSTAREARWPKS